MKFLAGIDLGTTALKGVVVDSEGHIHSAKIIPTQYEYLTGNRVEFSPEEFYQKFCFLIRELLTSLPPSSIVEAISLSGATGNTLLLDTDGKPMLNAISWLDKRPVDFSSAYPGIDPEEVHTITGWPYLGIFPLAHLAWLKQHQRGVFRSAAHYVLNITYLYYRLTKRMAMDHSTATTFYLQDQVNRTWHQPFLDALGISKSQLPELLPSATVIGNISERAAGETGLSPDTKVVLGSFDHPAAARGTGVLQEGSLLLSCGTSWVGFHPVNDRSAGIDHQMLIDPFLSPAGPWGIMFSIPGIGQTIDHLIDHFLEKDERGQKYDLFNLAAARSPAGANETTLNILKPGEEIVEDIQKSKGELRRDDLFRAIMESTVYEMKHRMEQYEQGGHRVNTLTMVGGPAKSPVWTQITADITGHPVQLLNGQIAGALGSAIMAGIGAGWFRNEAEGFSKIGGKVTTVHPVPSRTRQYSMYYKEYLLKYPRKLN